MKNHKALRCPITLVEVMIVIGIMTTAVGFALRVIYAREIIEWEDGVVSSFGINPEIYRLVLALAFFAFLIASAIHQRRKRRNEREQRYQLPK